MTPLRILVRQSAFYAPLLYAVSGGFLRAESFDASILFSAANAPKSAAEPLRSGQVQVMQTGPSSSWALLEKGQELPAVHFAQLNERDGFFIASRNMDEQFTWDKLLVRGFMLAHGTQPEAMLAYAMHKKGVELNQVGFRINAGSAENMLLAWQEGKGEFFHEQGPYPQQLEELGSARIVASIGEVIGPVAFSSLAATREWLQKPEAKRFTRAYHRAREAINSVAPSEIATSISIYFPHIRLAALTRTIDAYRELGAWPRGTAISRKAYETTLDVFMHSKFITKRHAYEMVVVPPPED